MYNIQYVCNVYYKSLQYSQLLNMQRLDVCAEHFFGELPAWHRMWGGGTRKIWPLFLCIGWVLELSGSTFTSQVHNPGRPDEPLYC